MRLPAGRLVAPEAAESLIDFLRLLVLSVVVGGQSEAQYFGGFFDLTDALYSQFQKKSYKVSICPRKIFRQPTKMGGKRNR